MSQAVEIPTEREGEAAEFDLFLPLRSTGSLENPYPVYALLRTVRPVLEVPVPDFDGSGAWLLTRHRDVHLALRDSRFSANRMRAPLIHENLDRLPPFIRQTAEGLRTMLVMDPPDHTRVRKLVNKAFTPKRIAALRGRIEEIVDHQLDQLAEIAKSGPADLIHDLAEPLPAIVIAELLGVPAEDHRQFRQWSTKLIAGLASPKPEPRIASAEASRRILAYLSDIVAARRREPRDDLISAMIHAQEESDALSDEELLATCNLILLAGHETTTNLIGNGMLALLRHPDQLERLQAEPKLVDRLVEESLRYDPPIQLVMRLATRDTELGGVRIPRRSIIAVLLASANRDESQFESPDRFDIDRSDDASHMGFGFGNHYCIGAALAKLEGTIALEMILTRLRGIELAIDEVPRHGSFLVRGPSALPVKFEV